MNISSAVNANIVIYCYINIYVINNNNSTLIT